MTRLAIAFVEGGAGDSELDRDRSRALRIAVLAQRQDNLAVRIVEFNLVLVGAVIFLCVNFWFW